MKTNRMPSIQFRPKCGNQVTNLIIDDIDARPADLGVEMGLSVRKCGGVLAQIPLETGRQ